MPEPCPVCAGADPGQLIERMAEAMWKGRRVDADDPAWADAGDYCRASFPALATSAAEAVLR